jgi:phosphoglycolate phosphatase
LIWLVARGALVVVAGGFGLKRLARGASIDSNRLAKGPRGDVVRSVVATGKIQPITKVEVKSKASGIVEKLFADIDSRVRKGQPLAQLDQQEILAHTPCFQALYTGAMLHILRPIPVESLKLLAFDLDGTLIDSARDLCNSVNATLTRFGRQPLPDETVAGFIGNGAMMMVRRAFASGNSAPEDEDLLAEAYAFFLGYYREHKLDFTYAYDGVLDALAALKQLHDLPDGGGSGRLMAVLTNKPVRPARDICAALGMEPYFLNIYGGNSFPTKKPDPEGLRALMSEAGAKPEETVMIGDSWVDVETAHNAGAWSIGCTFGLSPESLVANPPDVLVDSPADWTAALGIAKIDLRQ